MYVPRGVFLGMSFLPFQWVGPDTALKADSQQEKRDAVVDGRSRYST